MSEWEQDPTVKAMLNMLGGEDYSIESSFEGCDFNNLWKVLQKSSRDCPISFYYLPIDGEIQQGPDDIYIKMNARGEHLTDFENFKADLNKHVGNKRLEWKEFDDGYPELKLSRLIDVEWANVFWNDLPEEQKSQALVSNGADCALPNTDKQFFAFLNRFFVNRLLCITKQSAKKLNEGNTTEEETVLFQYLYGKDGHADVSLVYKDFQIYENAGVISATIFKSLNTIFKNINKLDNKKCQPDWISKEDFHFLPYVDKQKNYNSSEEQLKEISQISRVVFYGICCYLENCQYPRVFDDNSFKEWMRFVWNMAKNSDVNTVDSMKNVLQKLHSVKDYTHDIILYLVYRAKPTGNKTYFERQWNEEIMKAKRLRYMIVKKAMLSIRKDTIIFEAEKFFHGNIHFLLNEKERCSLLNTKKIQKAHKFIKVAQNNHKEILKLLPYFKPKIIWDKELILKSDDFIKLINYDDRIIYAIQHFLMDNKNSHKKTDIDKESWIFPLTIKDDNDNTLFGYSHSYKIHIHHGKRVYLYNKTNWSKDCILLYSEDDICRLLIRNNIIAQLTKMKYEFAFDLPNDNNISIYPKNELEGRNIVLKKQNTYVVVGL